MLQVSLQLRKLGRPVTIISHPRSGTHLTIDLIRRQFGECQSRKTIWESYDKLYLSIEGFLDNRKNGKLTESEALNIVQRCERPIVKLHAYSVSTLEKLYPQWVKWLFKGDVIYVCRDVRPVLCSLHLYMQSFHLPSRVPLREFIRKPFAGIPDKCSFWNQEVLNWTKKKNVLILRFEDLINNTEQTITEIANHIKLKPKMITPLLPKRAKNRWAMRFNRFISTNPQSTAILGFYEGKQKVSWRKALSEKDLAFIFEKASMGMKQLNYIE